jgi:predicted exporter
LQRDLAALSPIPAAQQALDAELRRELGAPDVRSLFVIGPAASEAELLLRSEALGAALAPLIARGLLAGADLPSRYLPSAETQEARRAALPDDAALAEALRVAAAGLPFRPSAFDPFRRDVAASRTLPPLDVATFAAEAPTLSARLAPLLTRGGGESWAIAPATGVSDPAALEGTAIPGVLFLDVKREMERLLAAYGRSTLIWALAGGVLVLGLLGAGLGMRAFAVAAPIAGALVVAVALLAALGEALSLFHLAALLLLAGLAIDYALFLARRPGDDASAATTEAATTDATADATLGAVVTCALATLLTFGLLALCATPVLRGIGLTVSLGVVAAFVLACAASERPRPAGRQPA